MRCDEARSSLGAYALYALNLPERQEVTRHVDACLSCRSELDSFQDLTLLLDTVPMKDVLAEIRQTEQRPRKRVRGSRAGVLVAGLAALVLIFSGGALVVHLLQSPAVPATVQASTFSTTDATSHLSMRASLTAQPAGVVISLRLGGAVPGERCWLEVIARNGRTQNVVSWEVTYDGEADISAFTDITRGELVGLRVVREDHATLAQLRIS
jgi:hypothetical protein